MPIFEKNSYCLFSKEKMYSKQFFEEKYPDKLEPIGLGTFSNVYKTKEQTAIKVFETSKGKKELDAEVGTSEKVFDYVSQELFKEVSMLFFLHKQCPTGVPKVISFGRDYVEMELFAGNLWKENMKTKNPFQVTAYKLVTILAILHNACIIHRDIKPANIFVAQDGSVKLGDFASAAQLVSMISEMTRTEEITTSLYRAPEVSICMMKLSPTFTYTKKLDVWSLGVVLIELLIGEKKPLFRAKSSHLIFLEICTYCGILVDEKNNTYKYSLSHKDTRDKLIPAGTDPDLKDMLLSMIEFDPNDRADINDILYHPYFQKFPHLFSSGYNMLQLSHQIQLKNHRGNLQYCLNYIFEISRNTLFFHESIGFRAAFIFRRISNYLNIDKRENLFLHNLCKACLNAAITTCGDYDNFFELHSKYRYPYSLTARVLDIARGEFLVPTEYEYFLTKSRKISPDDNDEDISRVISLLREQVILDANNYYTYRQMYDTVMVRFRKEKEQLLLAQQTVPRNKRCREGAEVDQTELKDQRID